MKDTLRCPHCGKAVEKYRNPFPTVDIIIEMAPSQGSGAETKGSENAREEKKEPRGIVLIERKKPPYGWALPGGFVDYGESVEKAAVREAREETSLDVELLYQLGAYSDPGRDPRHHTITVVFVARGSGEPRAADDAKNAAVFTRQSLPDHLAFDHALILRDYFERSSPARPK